MNLPAYTQADFDGDKEHCDLTMKGGITSEVVYPFAVTELATKRRFENIGGISAGAIAAAITAAAEYNRTGGGFLTLSEIPQDIGERLLPLFQPTPPYHGLFKTVLSSLSGKGPWEKVVGACRSALRYQWPAALVGLLPAALLLVHMAMYGASWLVGVVALTTSLLGPLLAILIDFAFTVFRGLPKTNFGLCSGLTQPGYGGPGLTDWLVEKIETVAGRTNPDGSMPETPLTFGDLRGRAINLEIMTTNLSVATPYQLPQAIEGFYFREDDFERILPKWIVEYLKENGEAVDLPRASGLRRLPSADKLPVAVAVRMGLGFPILVYAVPLYMRSSPFLLNGETQQMLRRCWFSDAGISGNFPIRLFDSLWSTNSTSAYSVEEHNPN